MSYGPNTSRTNRLPHNFYEHTYERLEDSGDVIKRAEDNQPLEEYELLDLIRFFDGQLRRMRQSHLGWETL
jgi:hypothetical protein